LKAKAGGNLFLRFLLTFGLIFAVLIAPWPGWNEAYGDYFRAFADGGLNAAGGEQMVRLSVNLQDPGSPNLDTRIKLGNRKLLDASGRGLLVTTGLDSRSIGWVPTALTLALILATPIPWRRRAIALLGGLVLIHAFILLSLQAWIWDSGPGVNLGSSSPHWAAIAEGLDFTLIHQLGASFSVPVLVWILVTFRRQDAAMLGALMLPAAPAKN
jgi:hypothetical protein